MTFSRSAVALLVGAVGSWGAGSLPLRAQAPWSNVAASGFVTGASAPGPGGSAWFVGMQGTNFVTASWSGSSWVPQPVVLPPARHGHALAYDPVRARIVLFGGRRPDQQALFGDVWEFDGATWAQRTW